MSHEKLPASSAKGAANNTTTRIAAWMRSIGFNIAQLPTPFFQIEHQEKFTLITFALQNASR
jgi:hypothetical protein